jgi:hypothetical protein
MTSEVVHPNTEKDKVEDTDLFQHSSQKKKQRHGNGFTSLQT